MREDRNVLDLLRADYTFVNERLARHYGIPGVALTGYGMEDDLYRSRDVGFAAHVVKPVDIAQLQSVIERVSATE